MEKHFQKCLEVCEAACKHHDKNVSPTIFADARNNLKMFGDDDLLCPLFVEKTYGLWPTLREASVSNAHEVLAKIFVFLPLSSDHQDYEKILGLAKQGGMSSDFTKQMVLELHRMVKYCILYVHVQKGPHMNDGKPAYRSHFKVNDATNFHMSYMAGLWKVNLTYE